MQDRQRQAAPWTYRAPAGVLLGAACAGVVIDRYWPQSAGRWSLLAALVLSVHQAMQPKRAAALRAKLDRSVLRARRASLPAPTRPGWLLLVAVAALFAAWHHRSWHTTPGDDLARLVSASEPSIPVLIAGRAATGVVTLGNDSLPGPEGAGGAAQRRQRFRVRVGWLRRGGRWVPASGTLWVHVKGECPAVRPGDETIVWGNLGRYPPPMNPGEFDFQGRHRTAGELVYLKVPVARCIRIVERPTTWRSWLARLRLHWEKVLERELSGEVAPLAAALLLGAREGFSGQGRDEFVMTGTSHLLAISGLHVGILAAPWLFAVRARLVHGRGGLAGVMLIVTLYAALAEGRAPVVRASVLVQVLCCGWLVHRRGSLINSLGLAGLIVLLIRPAELFNCGTQLSFLAVAALGQCHVGGRTALDPLDQLVRRTRPWWSRAARRQGARVMQLVKASLVVWLATAPLTIQAFHILSPLTVPLNLVLFLPLAVALQSGFALLLLGDLCPLLVTPLAAACQASLSVMLLLVRIAAVCPGGHFWLAEPGGPAVIGAYVCIGLAWTALRSQRRFRWLAYGSALACLMLGWGHQAWVRRQARDNGLKCTVLSVGHGNCVVLQWPGGPVWLYDAGCRGAISFGVDRVARYLWSQGIWRIDTIVLSHADLDHYSLMPGLIERFGARRIYIGPEPLSTAGFAEAWLQSELDQRRLVPQMLKAGDRLIVGDRGTIDVLHPQAGVGWSNDNARSLVLDVRCDRASLLLPGDLEADGLDSLLSGPTPAYDVAMVPHHGSLASEPQRFLRWCRPRWCIISDSQAPRLKIWARYAAEVQARALHTAVHGAVEIELGRRGVRVQSFRGPADEPPAGTAR